MTNPTQHQPIPLDAYALARAIMLDRLKERLRRLGITQREIAAVAGVSRMHVCNVLAGRDTSARVLRASKDLLATVRAARG